MNLPTSFKLCQIVIMNYEEEEEEEIFILVLWSFYFLVCRNLQVIHELSYSTETNRRIYEYTKFSPVEENKEEECYVIVVTYKCAFYLLPSLLPPTLPGKKGIDLKNIGKLAVVSYIPMYYYEYVGCSYNYNSQTCLLCRNMFLIDRTKKRSSREIKKGDEGDCCPRIRVWKKRIWFRSKRLGIVFFSEILRSSSFFCPIPGGS